MLVARPTTLAEVFDALDELPDAHLLAGGTDLMVEVNFGHRRPPSVVALRRVEELRGYDVLNDEVVLRAGTTWTEVENDLVDVLPGLAAAARTVGSPQMRNAGTVGGNVGTASPAGDGLPVLGAMDATVVLASRGGDRRLPLAEFITGVKRTAIQPGEVIREVRVPRLDGPQQFLKVGTRNAMVISIVVCGLVVDRSGRSVRLALGSRTRGPGSASWPAMPPPPSPTSAARPSSAGTPSEWSPPEPCRGASQHERATGRPGRPAHRELPPVGQRQGPGGRRRLDRREPALRAQGAPRPPRRQERLRAGRVRLLLGDARRHPGGLLLRDGRRRGRQRRPHCRGPEPRGRADRRPAGLLRAGCRAVRLLHPRDDRGHARPAGPPARRRRAGAARGPLRQPVPLHRIRQDLRRLPRRQGGARPCQHLACQEPSRARAGLPAWARASCGRTPRPRPRASSPSPPTCGRRAWSGARPCAAPTHTPASG